MSLMRSRVVPYGVVAAALVVLAVWSYQRGLIASSGTIHVAVVSKGLGPGSDSSIQRGASLYAEQLNAQDGINGQKVVLDIYDDEGDTTLGRQRANEIVASDALAVIGHRFSSVSAAAGPIYKEAGVPVVSAASTSPNVTEHNDWYFRTIFNNNDQGRFLAGYISEVLKQHKVHVVHGSHGYGQALAQVFIETARSMQIDVANVWEVAQRSSEAGSVVARDVVEALQGQTEPGLLFLITYPEEAMPVIKAVRDAGIDVQIMGVNALARRDLPGLFADLPRERAQPGFYTNGLMVATPLIYDTANQFTGEFKRRYVQRFGAEPDWRAAFAYDALKVITESLRGEASAPGLSLAQRREALRNRIAKYDGPDRAIPGVTGENWFDRNGDPQKPVSVAVFQQGVMVSAPFQLTDLRPGDKTEEFVTLGERKMRRTEIVYTGADISRIDEVDMDEMTARIRGEIWFRHRGESDVANIVFLNALSEVSLGESIAESETEDGARYSRYPFDGQFFIDQLPGEEVFREHLLGINFRHKTQDRNGVVYVNDLIGMGLDQGASLTQRLKDAHALAGNSGWRILHANISSEVIGASAKGDPTFNAAPGGERDFSTFNLVIRFGEDSLSVRRSLSVVGALVLVLVSLAVWYGVRLLWRSQGRTQGLQRRWLIQGLAAVGMLIGLEAMLVELLNGELDLLWLSALVKGFDVLWWLVPAYFLVLALERFVWLPVEEKSDRPVPTLLTGFVSILVYLFAVFGIIAFVFDEKVTGLLASSGVIAMIIGLAIQLNISHLFSGIALNLERPFRVGDWVKIGDHEDAKVVSMNWRATRLMTRNLEIINLPNTKAAESTIKNYAMPTDVTRLMHKVRVHPTHDTREVAEVLTKACLAVDGVLDDPYPIIFYLGVGDWASEFNVAFFIGDYQFQPKLMTDVWHSIWKHLKEAGMEPEIQRQNIRLLEKGHSGEA